ncbi:tRNA(Ile)(2)-agmatinylcytidine synthase [Halorubrum vacuolatum]|uniref:tRNA(Ile2) 2-agmatinylcytidine synthetase TiaS n=1 Tax=Halorubrum vacuolatum TaxID=63740 RepID=A0A238VQJ9_HALVU|nr:tRNA(Ile)(2)-agmatinylcytidine synthase [Halorubrum vacuolatum]SNR36063.1 tRNA(Ile2) 2-agmatinylcytidine synthetase [Halorubrum vacuolatum]
MPIVAIDDTDSRVDGMCTTYVATRLAERLVAAGASVDRRLLIRLNPAVKYKTRGNAAVALHAADISPLAALDLARDTVRTFAVVDDDRTSPGVVVADLDVPPDLALPPGDGTTIPEPIASFTRRALRERLTIDEAVALADTYGFLHAAVGGTDHPGRGRIGALAAVGAPAAFDDWTVEHISYRELDRCGTPREVDADSVFAAAADGYPVVWDTVDRGTGEVVCVPNAPGPILHGIRGDDAMACRSVAEAIRSEPVDRTTTFLTNQGTDVHLEGGAIGDLRDGASYRVDGVIAAPPETKRGGHVHVALVDPETATSPPTAATTPVDPAVPAVPAASADPAAPTTTAARELTCVAFKPTGRFRDHVRALRAGDRVTVCGECERRPMGDPPATRETLKLEKFAVRRLVRTEPSTPTCPECDRRMSSAGRDQGYRCRDCDTAAPGRVDRPIDRSLEPGWYEVPPSARRHIAKPLIRGGFDAPSNPER